MKKNVLILFIFFFVIVIYCENDLDKVSDQLIQSGYSTILKNIEETRTRYKSIYPDGQPKEHAADNIYGDDYVIKDIDDVDDGFKDKVIMYYPAVTGNTLRGLTGLVNTIAAGGLKKGEYAIGGKLVMSKIQKSNGDKIDFASGEKADISSFYTTAAMGVSDNFEVGYSLPMSSFTINSSDLYPYDVNESGVGDVALRGKFSFPFGNEDGYAGLGFGVKLPSGNDEKMSPAGATGEPEIEILALASSKFGLINGHFNLIYSFTGSKDDNNKPYTYNDNRFLFNLGLDYSRNEIVTLMLEITAEDWGAYGNRADFVPGVRAKIDENISAEIAFPISITNEQYYGYNYKMLMGMAYTF
ncbi:MAG: hypothetical protein ACQESP_06575 [Candidatus Muiribacteriota bacterium]